MTTFHIITLFPESFTSYLNESILARAQKEKKIAIKFYNPREFVKPTKSQLKNERPYLRVDDRPYGGGPGMVIQAMPVIKSVEKALAKVKQRNKAKIIFLSPEGTQFDTEYAKAAAKKYTDIVIICGRYEGIDARIKKVFKMEDVTVGPYVLTGGELPAMLMVDSISRQVEGVLGNFSSLEETRVSSNDVYTRPEVIEYKKKKYRVPKILLTGNHKQIEGWKKDSKK